jgi:hypothetical protein
MTTIPAPAWSPGSTRPPPIPAVELEELGRGCSGVVYVSHELEGPPVARKVFGSEGVTRLADLVIRKRR